jgi:hypothetical protein
VFPITIGISALFHDPLPCPLVKLVLLELKIPFADCDKIVDLLFIQILQFLGTVYMPANGPMFLPWEHDRRTSLGSDLGRLAIPREGDAN